MKHGSDGATLRKETILQSTECIRCSTVDSCLFFSAFKAYGYDALSSRTMAMKHEVVTPVSFHLVEEGNSSLHNTAVPLSPVMSY